MIDHSDAVGFPVPEAFGAYYDRPRRRLASNGQYSCQHGLWAWVRCQRCDKKVKHKGK